MIYTVYTDVTLTFEASNEDAAHEFALDYLCELDHPQFITEPDVGVLAVERINTGSI